MNGKRIERIVIAGGGAEGWMAAAPLAKVLLGRGTGPCEIVLVESPGDETADAAESTLPALCHYNRALGIDEADFIRRTHATFKLGIEFQDWGQGGRRFFHGFGDFGPAINNRPAYTYWLRLSRRGDMPSHEEWSVPAMMARRSRFAPPSGNTASPANAYAYAYHLDAGRHAAYLREYAGQRGVRRLEGEIADIELRPADGFVAALRLHDGRRVEGDLFIDCTGARALLMEGAMKIGYEDWTRWLPCDRAWTVPCAKVPRLKPYTVAAARSAGWQWRVPLQHRTGNGHVYSSAFMKDDEAARALTDALDGQVLQAPRPRRFTNGRRRKAWVKNVVALGEAGGFLEPLESTGLQLVMDGIGRLIELFPDRDFHPRLAAEFNRRMARQYESIRDFLVLHYKLTQRTDSEFWLHCMQMSIPDTLRHQIELFRACGRVALLDPEGFAEPSWVALLLGLGATPQAYDPFRRHDRRGAVAHPLCRLAPGDCPGRGRAARPHRLHRAAREGRPCAGARAGRGAGTGPCRSMIRGPCASSTFRSVHAEPAGLLSVLHSSRPGDLLPPFIPTTTVPTFP